MWGHETEDFVQCTSCGYVELKAGFSDRAKGFHPVGMLAEQSPVGWLGFSAETLMWMRSQVQLHSISTETHYK